MRTTRHPLNRRTFLQVACGSAVSMALGAPAVGRNLSGIETFIGSAFGTGWQITLASGTPRGPNLLAGVAALLDGVDRQMSPYRADSDITRFNTAGTGRCAIPGEMHRVTGAALALAEASRGAFDPTVGPLVSRWGFGPISGDPHPDWTGIALEPGAIVKNHASLTLDLCGIAKGYALDRIARLLTEAGHEAFLVDLGGEVIARGLHPSGRPWQVGVEDPHPEARGMAEVLALSDLAIATSGDRENGYTLGARRYSHIIDPATSEPVLGTIASVSVLAQSAMQADGWATALMAAGPDAGPALARAQGLSALFLLRGDAGLSRVTTGAFDAHLA